MGDVQDVVMMLHDFSFRSPEEILAGLGGANAHGGHGNAGVTSQMKGMQGMAMPGMDHSGHGMGRVSAIGGAMQGGGMMVHANDVA